MQITGGRVCGKVGVMDKKTCTITHDKAMHHCLK